MFKSELIKELLGIPGDPEALEETPEAWEIDEPKNDTVWDAIVWMSKKTGGKK